MQFTASHKVFGVIIPPGAFWFKKRLVPSRQVFKASAASMEITLCWASKLPLTFDPAQNIVALLIDRLNSNETLLWSSHT
jgi:hypothetical protein